MAYVVNESTGSIIPLKAYHLFGRLALSVDTVIERPEVSRIHCGIEWVETDWIIVDRSANGTFLNGEKLQTNQAKVLNVGDEICFSRASSNRFIVKTVTPPQDILVPSDQYVYGEQDILPLTNYNLLPNEDEPEIALYFDRLKGVWYLESTTSPVQPEQRLQDKDLIVFANRRWQLFLNQITSKTQLLETELCCLNKVNCIFNTSMDEEHTQLTIQTPQGEVSLEARIHHYLTLLLARYKAQSIANGIEESEQGWVYTEQLAKDLGLSEPHLNIQIHRARKQFCNAMPLNKQAEQFIQRRNGMVRLGISKAQIYKGQTLEQMFE